MIMDNDNIFQLCGKERPEIQGTTQTNIAYVDDLSQVIANENKLSLQEYIQTLYKVTASFFTENTLSINSKKSEFLLVPSNDDDLELFIMTHEGDMITGKRK